MRIRAALVAAAAVASGTTMMAAPADAASTICHSHTIAYAAFAGHKVQATFRECQTTKFYGAIGRRHFTSVSKPVVTYPTRVPTGLGETVKTTTKPYLYDHSVTLYKYRFTTQQGHVAVPFHSSYNFQIEVRSLSIAGLGAPPARICFLNPKYKCSSWQS